MRYLRFTLLICLAWALTGDIEFAAATPQEQSEKNLLENGALEKWKGSQPVDWRVEVTTTNGPAKPESKVRKGEGPSLEVFGNAKTTAWNAISQSIKVRPGDTYRLSFQAKTKGLKREGNQFDNCHVGFWFKDASGKMVGHQVTNVGSSDFLEYTSVARVPAVAVNADVMIVLTKTGRLSVKDLKLSKLDPKDSFELLTKEMEQKYSYFEHKKIDWPVLVDRYRDKANAAAKSKDEFTEIVADMLAEMKDGHTWIINDGKMVQKFSQSFEPNYNFQIVNRDLKNVRQLGQFALVGTTSDGFGYVRISTFSGVNRQDLIKLIAEIEKMFDAPGMIIDLRRNGGGDEPTAAAIASLFADKRYVYARQKFRDGDGFNESSPREIGPRNGNIYTRPFVCLIGPGAVSSAEGFALMLKAIPHCTTVGLPTRGSSGNPAPAELPNGVDVYFSRWMSLNPDGTPIEDVGVQPEIRVEHDVRQAADPAFEKARKVLAEKAGK